MQVNIPSINSGTILNIALKAEHLLGFLPSGWSDGILDYGSTVLTQNQLNTLSTGIKSSDGVFPAPIGTSYLVRDVMDNRAIFKSNFSAFGTPVTFYYSGNSNYIIQFGKTLTSQQRNNVANAWAGLLTQLT